MSTYNYDLYTITTKTNLHVGAGDNNFGIIDNQVQRDTITNLPIINSSSLKGALREYFSDKLEDIYPCTHPDALQKLKDNKDRSFINLLFGSEPKNSKEEKTTDSQAGILKFLSASLLAFPFRSVDKPYHLVTAPMVLNMLEDIKSDFKIEFELPNVSIESAEKPIILEDEEITSYKKIEDDGILKGTIMIEDATFIRLLSTLPFIPRNHLESGKSRNLWYEEIVPRESKFFFCIGKPDKSMVDFKKYCKFLGCMDNNLDNHIVQIGANASIGYGLCKIEKKSTAGVCDEQRDK